MARNYSNIAFDTTLTAGILAGDLTCVVASTAGWPSVPFAAVLDPGSLTIEEVVQVTLVVGTTFTITRGFDGTTAAAHANGATVRHAAIAGDFTDLQAADALLTPLARTLTINGVAFDLSANRSWTVGDAVKASTNVFTLHNAFGANGVIDGNTVFPTGLNYRNVVGIAEEMTVAGTFQRNTLAASLKINPSGASSGSSYGLHFEIETTAGNVQTHGAFLVGVFGSSRHRNAMAIANVHGFNVIAANLGGAAVTSLSGALLAAQNDGAGSVVTHMAGLDVTTYNSGGAVTTNAYGARIQAPVNSATITNNYGIHIGNITGGATLNYAVYTAGGEVRHLTGAAAVIGLTVQGATSQSANLQEWQDVSANVLGSVSSIGAALFRPRDAVTAAVTPALTIGHVSSGTPAASFGTRLLFQTNTNGGSDRDGAAIDTILTTAADATRTTAIVFYTVNSAAALAETLRIAPLAITATGALSPAANNTYNFGSSGARWKDAFFAGTLTGRAGVFQSSVVGDFPLIAKGLAGQTANLQEWQSSTAAILSTVSENGYFTTRKIAAPADAELAASELAFWFDSTNGAGKLMIKAKTIDGTVVTGNVALV